MEKRVLITGIFLCILMSSLVYAQCPSCPGNQNSTQNQTFVCPEKETPDCYGELINETIEQGCVTEYRCVFRLSNGQTVDVKVNSTDALEEATRALKRGGFFEVELREEFINERQKAIYDIVGVKKGRLLGIFPIRGKFTVLIDAETGNVLSVKGPWWSFLVYGF